MFVVVVVIFVVIFVVSTADSEFVDRKTIVRDRTRCHESGQGSKRNCEKELVLHDVIFACGVLFGK